MSSNERIVHVERVRRPAVEAPACFTAFEREWRGLIWRSSLIAAVGGVSVFLVALGPAAQRMLALVLTFLCAGVCCLMVMAIVMNRRVVWAGLRMRVTGPLRVPGNGIDGLAWVFAGACFLAGAGCILWSWFTPGVRPVMGPISPAGGLIFLLVAGLGCVVGGVARYVLPSGIEIDEAGLRVRKGLIAQSIDWADFDSAEARPFGRTLALVLTRSDRPSIIMPAFSIGSNPYFVAELIEFYDNNPAARHTLAEPFAAVEKALLLNAHVRDAGSGSPV